MMTLRIRQYLLATCALFFVLISARTVFSDDERRHGRDDDDSPKTLYIWSGSQVRTAPAFLLSLTSTKSLPGMAR
jgi:hypothetical protein